jgi:outer membrane lipase/esterase
MSSKLFARLAAPRWLWAVAIAGSTLLASCGGGQITPFVPTRVLAFGDELSTIEADGSKYSINAFKQVTVNGVLTDDPTTLDCTRNPLWIQTVATSFALAFDRCQGTATGASGQILARAGQPGTAAGKVADFAAQIAAVQGNVLGEKDLALVMFGINDVMELYASYPTTGRDALLAEARARGAALGTQINQLAQSGPAVVVLTMPDIGLSPFALAQNTSTGDATRSALISELVAAFNNRMSVALINDGRLIGLAYGDIEVQNEVKLPAAFGLTNAVAAACKPEAVLPACTTATLVDTATATGWLWADSVRLSPAGQARLGLLAQTRAHGNPF